MRWVALAVVAGAGCNSILGLRDTQPFDARRFDAQVFPTNVMFVTSTTHLPTTFNVDLSGGDAICAARAADAGLTDTFVAFLATDTNPASARLSGKRGWVRSDGSPFADTVADLQSAKIFNPPCLDETGSQIGAAERVAVGVPNTVFDCAHYTDPTLRVETGDPYFVSGTWQDGGNLSCSQALHVYCFGMTNDAPLVVTPQAGRRAFVSVQSFTPGGGLAAADAVCASDAQLAGLSGTFLALLATSTAGATARFSLTGPTWVRMDGIPIAPTPLAFATNQWTTAIAVTAAGAYVDVEVFGAFSLSAASSQMSTCNDWTDATGAYSAYYGRSAATDINDIMDQYLACRGAPLYCLEP
jgi:hypothetical protein